MTAHSHELAATSSASPSAASAKSSTTSEPEIGPVRCFSNSNVSIFTRISRLTSCSLTTATTTPSEAQVATKTAGAFTNPGYWILFVCATLSVCAGMVNAIAFRNLGSFVSHATGSTTKVGMFMEGAYASGREDPWDSAHAVMLVLSFLVGAMMCGFLVWKNAAHYGKELY